MAKLEEESPSQSESESEKDSSSHDVEFTGSESEEEEESKHDFVPFEFLADEDEDEDDDDEGLLRSGVEASSSGRGVLGLGEESEEEEEDSMEGSRSRSEEDLRDIGSARRLDDDDAVESAWKDEVGGPGNPGTVAVGMAMASSGLVHEEVEGGESEEIGAASGSRGDGEEKGEAVEAMEMEEEEEKSEGESQAESQSEGGSEGEGEGEGGEPSVSGESGAHSDVGSDGKDGGESPKSTAYSRAFSKIIKNKATVESETGPVLAARQTLVAKKLEEEAGEVKEKKETRKEKKELREKAHLYPQSFADTKEKDLVKLATRGVVKLFNAVSKAQKVQANADGRDAKLVAKKSKSVFLSEVRGGQKGSSTLPFKFGTAESQEQPHTRWSVVQDGFMLGKQKLKDWDKEEEPSGAEGNRLSKRTRTAGRRGSDEDDSDDN